MHTVSKQCRSTCHDVPYTKYTMLMVILLIQNIVKWLKAFPSKRGVPEEMIPETIVTGVSKPDFNRKRTPFGGYAMIYTSTENNTNSITVPVVSLKEPNYMN